MKVYPAEVSTGTYNFNIIISLLVLTEFMVLINHNFSFIEI